MFLLLSVRGLLWSSGSVPTSVDDWAFPALLEEAPLCTAEVTVGNIKLQTV